jgi:hypothetical protein
VVIPELQEKNELTLTVAAGVDNPRLAVGFAAVVGERGE